MTAKIKGSAKKGAKAPAPKKAQSTNKKQSKSAKPAKATAGKQKKAPYKKTTGAGKIKQTAKKTAAKNISGGKQSKKAPARKVKSAASPQAKKTTLPPVTTPVLTHGPDQHFIPQHIKNAPAPIHDAQKEEQIFHNREESCPAPGKPKNKSKHGHTHGLGGNSRILSRG